jgi:hypothetical protein
MSLLKKYADLFDPQESFLAVGPKFVPLNYLINLQKGGTIFFMFFLMCYYNNFSQGAWVYLALHGSYGIKFNYLGFVWVMKDIVFPDKSFSQKVGLAGSVAVASILLAYWGMGFLMMSGSTDTNPSPERIFCCIFMYVIGLVLMVLTDLQKYITLQYKYLIFTQEGLNR